MEHLAAWGGIKLARVPPATTLWNHGGNESGRLFGFRLRAREIP